MKSIINVISENRSHELFYGNVIGETGGTVWETHSHLHSTKFKQSSAITFWAAETFQQWSCTSAAT